MLLFSPRITRRGLAVCMVVAAGVGAATAGDPAGPRTADVTFELVALPAPSGGDATATLPASTLTYPVGSTAYLEVWVSDVGALNTGLTSAYVDVSWPAALGAAGPPEHRPPFTLFASGTVLPGLVDELGGSDSTLSGQGVAPVWARLVVVPLTLTAAGDLPVTLNPAATAVAAYGRGIIPAADTSYAGLVLNPGQDVAYALRAVASVTGSDRVTSLPPGLTCVPVGGHYYVELWVSDVGSLNTGVTSAYVDLSWPAALASAGPITYRATFPLFPSGTVGPGLVNELGASTLQILGVQPEWVRVAAVQFTAMAPGAISFATTPSATATAAFGRGIVPPAAQLHGTCTVYMAPQCAIATLSEACAGQVGLAASIADAGPGATYAWTITNGTITSGQGTASISYDVGTAGLLSLGVTVVDEHGCACTGNADVTVYPNPTPAIVAAPGLAVCDGVVVTLDAGAGYAGYAWSTGSATRTIEVLTGGTYTVTVTDSHGCQGSASATVTVNPLPVVLITSSDPDNTICAGETLTLTATGATAYAWSTGDTTAAITVSPAETTTYSVTGTDSNGCTDDASITITVNPQPLCTITTVAATCAGGGGLVASVADAGPGATYIWTIANGVIVGGQGSPTLTYVAGDAGLLTLGVQVTTASGCACSGGSVVTVNANPEPVITATPSAAVCAGTPVTLDAGPGYAAYAWSTGATSQTITVTSAGLYSVAVTDGQGCSGSASIEVTVHPNPVCTIASASPVCAGAADLSATVADAGPGAVYAWSVTNGTLTTGQGTPAITFTAGAAGTLMLAVTVTRPPIGCTCTDTLALTVLPLPEPTITSTAPGNAICLGESVTLSVTGGPYTSYLWSPGGETTASITVAPSETTTYGVTVTDAGGCSGNAAVTIVVHPLPSVSITATPADYVCHGLVLTLDAGVGFASYLWSPDGQTTRTIQVNAPGTYAVMVTNVFGCAAVGAIEIAPGLGGHGDSDCDGDVDFDDIDPFVSALSGETAWRTQLGGSPACDYLCVNDINGDGVVSFDDVDPFVACLGNGCP